MTLRVMSEQLRKDQTFRCETYRKVNQFAILYQKNNGINGSYWIFIRYNNEEEIAVEYDPKKEIIDVWNN